MNKVIVLLSLFIPTLIFAQSAKDINTIIQKTIDLHALKGHYKQSEISGDIPLIILNDNKIPDNLIVFKFKKRVQIMTPIQLETYKSNNQNHDSYFIFEVMKFEEDEVSIKAAFRNRDKIDINVNMKKEEENWIVTESYADHDLK